MTIPPDRKRCKSCGALNGADAGWCGQCLIPFISPAPPPPPPPPLASLSPETLAPAPVAVASPAAFQQWSSFPDGLSRSTALERVIRGDTSFAVARQCLAAMLSSVPMLSIAVIGCVAVTVLVTLAIGLGDALANGAGWISAGLAGRGFLDGFWLGLSRYVALAGVTYFLVYVFCIGCYSATIGMTRGYLEGRRPSFADASIVVVRAHVLALWSVVAASVNALLHAVEFVLSRSRRRRPHGRLMAVKVAGVSWTAMTFFVVPTILFEKLGPIQAIRRSARLVRERWGEVWVVSTGIGLGVFLVGMPFFVAARFVGESNPMLALQLFVYPAALLAVIASCLSGVFSASLYHFATTGEPGGLFTRPQLDRTFEGSAMTQWDDIAGGRMRGFQQAGRDGGRDN